MLQNRWRKRHTHTQDPHDVLSQKCERKLNTWQQPTQTGKFLGFTGARPEGLVPSGPQPCRRLRLDEEQCLMNEKAQMRGRWKGHEEGRQCKTEPVGQQHAWTRTAIRVKSPRLNFLLQISEPTSTEFCLFPRTVKTLFLLRTRASRHKGVWSLLRVLMPFF